MARRELTQEQKAAQDTKKAAAEKSAQDNNGNTGAGAKKETTPPSVPSPNNKLKFTAERHLANYPNCKVIYGTADGQFFLENAEQQARVYANSKGIELYEFYRPLDEN